MKTESTCLLYLCLLFVLYLAAVVVTTNNYQSKRPAREVVRRIGRTSRRTDRYYFKPSNN